MMINLAIPRALTGNPLRIQPILSRFSGVMASMDDDAYLRRMAALLQAISLARVAKQDSVICQIEDVDDLLEFINLFDFFFIFFYFDLLLFW